MKWVDPSGMSTKEFIAKHDATSLLEKYMNDARDELSFGWVFPKWGYSQIDYGVWSFSAKKWNIKYNVDFQTLAFDPSNNNQSCATYGNNWAWWCKVYIEWESVELSELWNFLIWYNWVYAGYTLNDPDNVADIYKSGMFVEYNLTNEKWTDRTREAALNDELQDRKWYDIGYKKWAREMTAKWGFQRDQISLKEAIIYWNTR